MSLVRFRVHLECRLEPVNDPNLRVEWFINGKSIKTGHRFRTTHDFGFVALDILYAYPEDTGTYMCKAVNKLGEAVNTCSVEVVGELPELNTKSFMKTNSWWEFFIRTQGTSIGFPTSRRMGENEEHGIQGYL